MSEQTPRYGHAPIKMRRVSDEDAMKLLGDFTWDIDPDGSRHILLTIPRPRPDKPAGWLYNRLPVKKGENETGKHWGWDGNEDSPTLKPSIHCIGHWHGWIRAGEMVEA